MDCIIKDKTRGFVGKYRMTTAHLELPEHFALQTEIVAKQIAVASLRDKVLTSNPSNSRRLNETLKELMQDVLADIRHLNKICRVDVLFVDNLVPTVGRTLIANNLTDATPTNTMLLTHGVLGSSTTAPANGDTQMGTETYRNAIASITNANNIAYATAFFSATETSGTYREAGIVSNGTGSANSGILVSHVAINVTKSTSESLTIDWELTIS